MVGSSVGEGESATPAAELAEVVERSWLAENQTPFPKRVVIIVLVESDEEVPFREGSRDAAPIGKVILDWIEGKQG